MKAFIVTILAPDSWTKTDVLSSCNIGIRKYSQDEHKDIRARDYHAVCNGEFTLSQEAETESVFERADD